MIETTYQVVRIGRATTMHFCPRIDLGDGRIFENARCRFSHGRITWRSQLMDKQQAIIASTCRACVKEETRRMAILDSKS